MCVVPNTEEYNARQELVKYIERHIAKEVDKYIDEFEGDYSSLLQCTLIDIEENLLDGKKAESIENFCRRFTTAFIITNIIGELDDTKLVKSTNKQQEHYKNEIFPTISRVVQNYRTLIEVKDCSSFAKSKLNQVDYNVYELVTSLVSDKYEETAFYFHGFEDPMQMKKEQELIIGGTIEFIQKYGFQKEMIKLLDRLHIDVDYEVLQYCESAIRKDVSKLGNDIRSDVFKSAENVISILGFLYYLAFVTKNKCEIYRAIGKCVERSEYLMVCPKRWLIEKINKLYGINEFAVEKFINYLINDKSYQLLEFPLFEQAGYIITSPSLIMVNDWQFTLVNGHYYKGIKWKNKNKTISMTIANKIDYKLESKHNIKVARDDARIKIGHIEWRFEL